MSRTAQNLFDAATATTLTIYTPAVWGYCPHAERDCFLSLMDPMMTYFYAKNVLDFTASRIQIFNLLDSSSLRIFIVQFCKQNRRRSFSIKHGSNIFGRQGENIMFLRIQIYVIPGQHKKYNQIEIKNRFYLFVFFNLNQFNIKKLIL